MKLYQKARAVEKLYLQLERDMKKYTSTTSLHCLSSCGLCCTKPDVEATVLEFLPLAMHYYLEGRAEEMLLKLETPGSLCHIFSLTNASSGSGFCGNYLYRGLICRLFGFSARKTKDDSFQLYTCSLIKNDQPQEFARTTAEINRKGGGVPVVSHYYQRLNNIDPTLCSTFYPINVATKKALEEILHYYAYRRPPRGIKRIA